MRAPSVRFKLFGVLAPVTLALLVAAVPPVTAEDQILIETGALRPPVFETTVGHRVTFVNRSGRIAHVEFLGESSAHRVFQVPGEIWAVFHRPGRHEYVIHFSGRIEADLRGAVEVREDAAAPVGPLECEGLTVMGVCFER